MEKNVWKMFMTYCYYRRIIFIVAIIYNDFCSLLVVFFVTGKNLLGRYEKSLLHDKFPATYAVPF